MLACNARSSFGQDSSAEPLSQLIAANEEAEENLRAAANAVRDTGLRAQFDRFAQQRATFAAELRQAAGRMGAASSSVAHRVRRVWNRMWNATMPADDQLALEEAEAAEETTVRRYRAVLRGEAGKRLSGELRAMVEGQYQSVRRAFDLINCMRFLALAETRRN